MLLGQYDYEVMRILRIKQKTKTQIQTINSPFRIDVKTSRIEINRSRIRDEFLQKRTGTKFLENSQA